MAEKHNTLSATPAGAKTNVAYSPKRRLPLEHGVFVVGHGPAPESLHLLHGAVNRRLFAGLRQLRHSLAQSDNHTDQENRSHDAWDRNEPFKRRPGREDDADHA